MKRRKLILLVLAFIMIWSTIFTGCGSKNSGDNNTTSNTNGAIDNRSGSTEGKPLTLEVYNVAANYQGISTGWFAEIIKQKFNLELNIIAPQISGDSAAIYQTRCSSGKLGDIILLDNDDYIDCVKSGLIRDLSSDIWNYSDLSQFKNQIEAFNNQIEGADGKIYGIPTEMANTDPTSYSQTSILSSPIVPWDYYKNLGCPSMSDLNDLLDVLEQMQTTYPTNADGEKAYAISLWNDWDNMGIENVNQLTKWYGEEVNESVLIGTDGSMKSLVDDSGAYYKMLCFFYDANQRGLIDPDSGSQDWNAVFEKMKAKRIYLFWYNWSVNFYNTLDHTSNGDGYMHVPVEDMNFYQTSDSYYGSGRAWGIGAHIDDETAARIMEFLNWYASPESVMYQYIGIKDFNYIVREDGTFEEINASAVPNNDPVPEEYGGGGVADGRNQLNQWIVSSVSINPESKESYTGVGWTSNKEKEPSELEKQWRSYFDANSALELMQKLNNVKIVPTTNLVLARDTTDMALIRSQCKEIICNYSWKMIYAKNSAEFESLWSKLEEKLNGLGWEELLEFDMAKYQQVIDMRKASTK